jgi:hypothetical protein
LEAVSEAQAEGRYNPFLGDPEGGKIYDLVCDEQTEQ